MAKALRKTQRPTRDGTGHGFEPESGQVFETTTDMNYVNAQNWYSWKQSETRDKFRKEAWEWMTSELGRRGFDVKDVTAIKRSGFKFLTSTDFGSARMMTRGCTLPIDTVSRFEEHVQAALEHGRTIREEIVEKIKSKDSRSPAQRNRDTAMSYRAEIDYLFDQVWTGEAEVENINFFDLFGKLDVKPLQAGILAAHYKPELDEMILMSDRKWRQANDIILSDEATHKRLTTFCEERQKALQGWALGRSKLNKVIAKKTGVKKKIANVSTLKYKQSDDDLKLVSIDPSSILGASVLVMYNTKYRQLTVLRAATADGLSIKGTTILNAEPESSETKRAGRDAATIREMASANKTQIGKLFQSINSQLLDTRMRTSEEVILVRALK